MLGTVTGRSSVLVLPFPPAYDSSLPSNHIIDGTDCNQGRSAVLSAHVRVAPGVKPGAIMWCNSFQTPHS